MKRRVVLFAGLLLAASAVVLAFTWRPHVYLRPAFSNSFVDAQGGLPALRKAYGLRFAEDVEIVNAETARLQALADGRVDVVDADPDDPHVQQYDLRVLGDPKDVTGEGRFIVVMTEEKAGRCRIDTFTDLAESQQTMLLGFFHKHGRDILAHTAEHLLLTAVAMAVAIALALPVGIYLSKTPRQELAFGVMSAASIIQTVPSLALVALVALVFALVHLPTIGLVPGITALVLYALLPILRNTYTGIRQVDPAVIEVARGMGMTRTQILLRIELPMSLPVIMAGIRIATVWTIGIATLVCLVGAGGLGDLIMQGLRSFKLDYLAAGTLPAAALALAADTLLAMLENRLTPKGLRVSERAAS